MILQKKSLYLPINVVIHGDVGVRDVDLDVEVGDVFDPGVVAVPHQRLHGDDCVNWKYVLRKIALIWENCWEWTFSAKCS